MKTPEEFLNRGEGNFIHCTDYDDAIQAMKDYAEQEVKKISIEDTKKELLMRNLLQFGTGQSSEAIMNRYLGITSYYDYPYDCEDLIRCITVVQIFQIDINIMKETNKVWEAIVDNWKNLSVLSLDIKTNEREIDEFLFKIRNEK